MVTLLPYLLISLLMPKKGELMQRTLPDQILAPHYVFRDLSLLQEALTHSSWANEHPPTRDNERLEFLGDAILQFLATEALYLADNQSSEGQMTSLRQLIVREEALAAAAVRLNLGSHLYLGQGEIAGGGSAKSSNLADAFEALLAAVFLDAETADGAGLAAARLIAKLSLKQTLDDARAGKIVANYKSQFLEWVQEFPDRKPVTYKLVKREGPAHEPIFHMVLEIGDYVVARAQASSKKQAEQALSEIAWKKRAELEEVIKA